MITARVSKSLFITRRYKGLDLILNSLSLALADFKNSAQFEWDYQTYQDDITMFIIPNHHVVKLNYPSFEIEVKTVVRQVDVYQFVSFFGGSLGLFLGFAIYDTLLHAFKLALKLWEKRKSMRLIDLELM